MSKALYIGWHNLIKTALPKGMAILALLLVVTFIPVEVEAQAGGISASQIVSLTNATRSGVGVSTLAVSSQLQQSAQLKAQDMADKGYFAHADAQGRRLGYWMSVTGYNYKSAGENLAMGFETAQGAINGWKIAQATMPT